MAGLGDWEGSNSDVNEIAQQGEYVAEAGDFIVGEL